MDLCSKPEAVNNYINTEAGPSYEMDGGYSPNKKEHICAGAKNKSPNTQLPSMWAWKAPQSILYHHANGHCTTAHIIPFRANKYHERSTPHKNKIQQWKLKDEQPVPLATSSPWAILSYGSIPKGQPTGGKDNRLHAHMSCNLFATRKVAFIKF